MFSPHLQTLTFRRNRWETVARLVLLGEPQGTWCFSACNKTCSTKQPRIQVEKHMIVTATTEVYIATAFGPWFYRGVFVAAVLMFDVWTWGVVQWIPTTFRFCLWSMRAFGKNVGEEWDVQIGSQVAMCELCAIRHKHAEATTPSS